MIAFRGMPIPSMMPTTSARNAGFSAFTGTRCRGDHRAGAACAPASRAGSGGHRLLRWRAFHSERRLGLVGDNFSKKSVIDRLPGNSAIGHTRYSTTGETILRNVQPLFAELSVGGFAIAHNGNLTNG